MNIAIIGADGQLGTDLNRVLEKEEITPLYYPDFNIIQPDQIKKTLFRIKPEVVINTAAYHKVDDCEDHVIQAFQVNAKAVRDLAHICQELDAVLVHFSTDYVFDGKKEEPYIEDDAPNPLSVYAASKLTGEYFIRNLLHRYYLIRTCGLYGVAGCWGKGNNFVDSMIAKTKSGINLSVVDDQTVTPTSTKELADRVSELIRSDSFGLYHMTNEGKCTWYEFAETIFSLMGEKVELEAVSSSAYPMKARRPHYSVLENRNAKKIGITGFSHWKDALKDYLVAKGYLRGEKS